MPRSDADRLRRRELYDAAAGEPRARLLPWSAPEGLPCYLRTDDGSVLSELADSIEAVQLGMGAELLEHARGVLKPGARALSAIEYRWLSSRLTEALSDVLRVAESRGRRIPVPGEASGDA
ncbi:hypothetical protein [Streptomyces orinoci]|uniref:Uncharacterized protein n=1 Tax=Streptomyces orinoci TaxID=67339 RepID=A0ABV3K303_STRON|nr:hypothetical protein [Streptomyces orinoci]